MASYDVVLFLLAVAVVASSVAPRIGIPYPVMLLLVGIGIGFIPGVNYIPVTPDLVFLLFLPPLLYDAAIDIDYRGFRRNIGTISMLAVTMVFVTMAAIAVTAYYMIPGITWPVAFVIGAILSPPDAVAASGIIRNMKLPSDTKAILEGESLVNDASALTAYRLALGAVTGGGFVLWRAGLEFVLIIAGGIVTGVVISYIFFMVLRLVKLQGNAVITFNILVPFVAYQSAEIFGVSGVLAVVTFGVLTARKIHRGELFNSQTVEQSRSVWSVIMYALSGLIFILIGLEFPYTLHMIPSSQIVPLLWSGVAIFAVALVTRIIFVFEHKYSTDGFRRRFHKGGRTAAAMDWRNALVVGWSRMRGIVSVATALAIPVTLAGEEFPARAGIIFLTVVVVVLMLIIQGMGLPLLIRFLGIEGRIDKNNAEI